MENTKCTIDEENIVTINIILCCCNCNKFIKKTACEWLKIFLTKDNNIEDHEQHLNSHRPILGLPTIEPY